MILLVENMVNAFSMILATVMKNTLVINAIKKVNILQMNIFCPGFLFSVFTGSPSLQILQHIHKVLLYIFGNDGTTK